MCLSGLPLSKVQLVQSVDGKYGHKLEIASSEWSLQSSGNFSGMEHLRQNKNIQNFYIFSCDKIKIYRIFIVSPLRLDLPLVSIQRNESCRYCETWKLCVNFLNSPETCSKSILSGLQKALGPGAGQLKSVSKLWSPRLQNLITSPTFGVEAWFKLIWKVSEKSNMNINRKF